MDTSTFLSLLRPLLADPAGRLDDVLRLLSRGEQLAEYEIARAVVGRAYAPLVEKLLADPRAVERKRALRLVRAVYGRSDAARVLRRAANDVHPVVRRAASSTLSALAPGDVAPPWLPTQQWARRATGWGAHWGAYNWFFGSRGRTPRRRAVNGAAVASAKAAGVEFPPTLDALATRLGLASSGELRALCRAGVGSGAPYVQFEVAKARGGTRVIAAPRPPLRRVQRVILRELLEKLPVHDECHGFVRGRSTVSNARPHEGASVVVKVDIQEFFPTVHFARVVGLLENYGAPRAVARCLAALTTYRRVLEGGQVAWPSVLPQGAPTSPALANLVCRRLDVRLSRLARKAGAVYTRYADDLTFSFHAPAREPEKGLGRFLWWVNAILQHEGFNENVSKRRILRRQHRQRVTGLVVNERVGVPRVELRRFRAVLHNCAREGWRTQARGRDDFAAYLLGYASYVKMVRPDLGKELVDKVRALLAHE